MANYDPSQQLNSQEDPRAWDDTITCSVEEHEFLAIVSNTIEGGATTREITVDVMTLDGVQTENPAKANTNTYIRQDGEKSVHVTIMKNDAKVGENTTDYPS